MAPGTVPTFTPDEANALVPTIKPMLARLRGAFHDQRFAREQWQDLLSFGEGESAEAREWRAKAEQLAADVRAIVEELDAMGVVVKDPLLGLVDLHARRADGEVVYLCYRDDEPRIAFWHPLDTGYAGRRPLAEL